MDLSINENGQFLLTNCQCFALAASAEKIMFLHKKLMKICNDRDLNSYLDLLHDDFTVVFHKSGNSFSKEEWSSMVAGMFNNEKFVFDSSR